MCPKCAGKTSVIGSVGGLVRERLRRCTKCGYVFPTIEAIKFDVFWKEYLRDISEINKKDFEKRDKQDG
jgi:transcriptional repressor NrdR